MYANALQSEGRNPNHDSERLPAQSTSTIKNAFRCWLINKESLKRMFFQLVTTGPFHYIRTYKLCQGKYTVFRIAASINLFKIYQQGIYIPGNMMKAHMQHFRSPSLQKNKNIKPLSFVTIVKSYYNTEEISSFPSDCVNY